MGCLSQGKRSQTKHVLSAVEWAKIIVLSSAFRALRKQIEKTKPIYSFRVLRAAYCEKEFEKTKPILALCKFVRSLSLQFWNFFVVLVAGKVIL
jgi:hypothetical protein